jgi:hypothetical protein
MDGIVRGDRAELDPPVGDLNEIPRLGRRLGGGTLHCSCRRIGRGDRKFRWRIGLASKEVVSAVADDERANCADNYEPKNATALRPIHR